MAADEETPFDRYRQRIDRPLVRLFRGVRTRPKALAGRRPARQPRRPGRVAAPARGARVGHRRRVRRERRGVPLPAGADGVAPQTQVEQFWFSAILIAGAFLTTAVFTWIYGVVANFFAHGVMHTVRSTASRR